MSAVPEKNIEQLKAAFEFAKQAISFSFLLNGGALIAILTFMGNAIDKLPIGKLESLSDSSVYFVCGLVLSAASSVIAYIAQLNYYKKDSGIEDKIIDPTALRYSLLIALLTSIALFALGAINSINSLK